MADQPLPEVMRSERVYSGRLFDVDREAIRFPDGGEAEREIIQHPGAVGMVPIDGDGNVHLVTQYRHAARLRTLEIPAGTLEPGEDPRDTAIRELQEEIGQFPDRVEDLGGFYVAPGYTSEYVWLYLCTEMRPSDLPGDDDEDIEIVRMPLAEALAATGDGRIVDAKSIVGLMVAAARPELS